MSIGLRGTNGVGVGVGAGTGVRGYLLTQTPDFLQPYVLARKELPKTLKRLEGSLIDPEQKGNDVARAIGDAIGAIAKEMQLC